MGGRRPLCMYVVIRLDPAHLVASRDHFGFALMDVYLLIVNLMTPALLIYDKLRAEQGRVDKRIPRVSTAIFLQAELLLYLRLEGIL